MQGASRSIPEPCVTELKPVFLLWEARGLQIGTAVQFELCLRAHTLLREGQSGPMSRSRYLSCASGTTTRWPTNLYPLSQSLRQTQTSATLSEERSSTMRRLMAGKFYSSAALQPCSADRAIEGPSGSIMHHINPPESQWERKGPFGHAGSVLDGLARAGLSLISSSLPTAHGSFLGSCCDLLCNYTAHSSKRAGPF